MEWLTWWWSDKAEVNQYVLELLAEARFYNAITKLLRNQWHLCNIQHVIWFVVIMFVADVAIVKNPIKERNNDYNNFIIN